jgi:hypothetical protein
MNITLSPIALSKVDTYRKARGIRSRKAALEAMILEVPEQPPVLEVAEHPLDKKLREARANPSKEKIPARVQHSLAKMREEQAAGTLETFSLSEVMTEIRRRQRGN